MYSTVLYRTWKLSRGSEDKVVVAVVDYDNDGGGVAAAASGAGSAEQHCTRTAVAKVKAEQAPLNCTHVTKKKCTGLSVFCAGFCTDALSQGFRGAGVQSGLAGWAEGGWRMADGGWRSQWECKWECNMCSASTSINVLVQVKQFGALVSCRRP